MRTLKRTMLAVALAATLPAQAAEPAVDVKKELQALKDKITELEQKQKDAPALAAGASGMSSDEKAEFNRILVKVEAMEDAHEKSGFDGLSVSGYLEMAYVFNANKERGTFQFLVPIAKEAYAYDNSYMGTAALKLDKEMDGGTKFRLTVVPSRSNADIMGEESIVDEAIVSIPLGGDDTRLLAGLVADWMGYEYLQPTLTKLISHNLTFDFTTPASYVGAGLEMQRGKWTIKALLVNVDTSVRNLGENIPAFAYRLDYAGGEFWGLAFSGIEGMVPNFRAIDSEGTGDPALDGKDSWVDTANVEGWYSRGDLSLSGNLVYGKQRKAAITAGPGGNLRDAQWYGASVYLGYAVTPRLSSILRGDYIFNQQNGGGLLEFTAADGVNGIGPDQNGGDPEKGADKYAITAGIHYAINQNASFKAEYRYDGATRNVFANKAALVDSSSPDAKWGKSNSLISTAVVVFF